MGGVNTIIEGHFKKNNTKMVKFKVDPTLKDGFDIAETYIGFVLTENYGIETVVYIPAGDMMGVHDIEGILPIPDKLDDIKCAFLSKLKNISGGLVEQIEGASTFEEIEQYARQCGLTDKDIIDVLKQCVLAEGFNPLRMVARGAEALGKFKNKVDSARYYLKNFPPSGISSKSTEYEGGSGDPVNSRSLVRKGKRGKSSYAFNPGLSWTVVVKNDKFMDWFTKRYGYGTDKRRVHELFRNMSVNQLNYYARKYFDRTGELIY